VYVRVQQPNDRSALFSDSGVWSEQKHTQCSQIMWHIDANLEQTHRAARWHKLGLSEHVLKLQPSHTFLALARAPWQIPFC